MVHEKHAKLCAKTNEGPGSLMLESAEKEKKTINILGAVRCHVHVSECFDLICHTDGKSSVIQIAHILHHSVVHTR